MAKEMRIRPSIGGPSACANPAQRRVWRLRHLNSKYEIQNEIASAYKTGLAMTVFNRFLGCARNYNVSGCSCARNDNVSGCSCARNEPAAIYGSGLIRAGQAKS